jgi:hypothetical protein
VAVRQPQTVALSRGGGMIAPISNQSIAFQKTQVTHGIREVCQLVLLIKINCTPAWNYFKLGAKHSRMFKPAEIFIIFLPEKNKNVAI